MQHLLFQRFMSKRTNWNRRKLDSLHNIILGLVFKVIDTTELEFVQQLMEEAGFGYIYLWYVLQESDNNIKHIGEGINLQQHVAEINRIHSFQWQAISWQANSQWLGHFINIWTIKIIEHGPIADFICFDFPFLFQFLFWFFCFVFGSLWGPCLWNIETTKIHLEKLPNDYKADWSQQIESKYQ